MPNQAENKICQNCKKDFIIKLDDFSFYEKIKVPPPTFCSWCRFIRRISFRNDRVLYKRNCDLCKKSLISVFTDEVPFPAYCKDCWYGDKWDATAYGRDYDFSRPFFEQLKELSDSVPHRSLWQRNVINSDYSNMVAESRNVYLSVSVVQGSENVFYSKCVDKSLDIFDSHNVINGSEKLYENVEAQSNYNSQYLLLCRSVVNSYYCVDCINCSDCFLSFNLRNKKFCIRNIQYTKDEYFKKLAEFDLSSRSSRNIILKEFEEIKRKAIYRFGNITRCVDVTGNNLLNVKNGKNCFEAYNAENFNYCYRAFTSKDCMDYDYGQTSELMYEYITGALSDYNVRFAYSIENSQNVEYSESCGFATNIFGCFGIRNKSNVILNKVYGKEEFEKLREKIIAHMNEMPYIDKKGRVYKYGEYFPIQISPFAYNETPAQEFENLSKEEALAKGYSWKDVDVKDYNITIKSADIPDNIKDVKDEILNEVLGCEHEGKCKHQCFTAFRITEGELQFYRQQNIPLPSKCANCRYYERFVQVPLPKLYKRTCMKCKKVEFETSYSPDRPEIIYCESCYNKEVY